MARSPSLESAEAGMRAIGAAGVAARPGSIARPDADVARPEARAHASGLTAAGTLAGLAAIVLVAAAVRVWQVGAIGLNTDEAVYLGQAAAIAGDEGLRPYFPLFRAHPLLYQFVLATAFMVTGEVSDVVGRLVSAGVGVLTVLLVYRLGVLLYTARVGLVAALLLALMPYHVVVTRQVLLDGPMVLFATLALYAVAAYGVTERPMWLYAAGAALGLTFMAKETSIILFGAVYALFALAPSIRVRLRDLALGLVAFGVTVAAVPAAVVLAGGGARSTTQQYLVWQLFRRPNHEADFYLLTVPPVIGPLVLVAAAVALWMLRRGLDWRIRLLLAWITAVVVFFQLWPVKGFQYLLPAVPPLCVLAALGIVLLADPRAAWRGGQTPPAARSRRQVLAGTLAALVLLVSTGATLGAEAWTRIQPAESAVVLAGAGGIAGGRETGIWIREHTPEGARLMTIGPSMANVLSFYGHRSVYGLSVSPNPLRRNPAYDHVANPDLQIRSNELHYVVWDSYSASRTPFFAAKLLDYVDRYHGRAVHTHTLVGPSGSVPVIVVYEVRR
jgi:4-amino-4-deoxy-L-arabinose transferase-like glycosyltransferase